MKKLLPLCAALLLLFCGGCTNAPAQTGTDMSGQVSASAPDVMPLSADTEIVFGTPEGMTDLISLAVDGNADVYAAVHRGIVSKYTSDGELLREYPESKGMCALRYADGYLYGFCEETRSLLRLDPESGTVRELYAGLPAELVNGLEVMGDRIFLVVIPSLGAVLAAADGSFDYGERFYTLGIETGELAEITAVPQPVTLYKSSEGKLFVYARQKNRYALYLYDAASMTAEQIAVMDDVGLLSSFAFEGNHFVWLTRTGNIRAKTMPDGISYTADERFPVSLHGCALTWYRGNLLYLENGENTEEGGVRTPIRMLRLDADAVIPVIGEEPIRDRGSVVISASSLSAGGNDYLNADAIYARTGIQPQFIRHFGDDAEFLTSLMAGDDGVDLYIMRLDDPVTQSIIKQGYYTSLRDSSRIDAYFDRCFDWVGEAARTQDGDIWMLPLYFETAVLWYVPENFENYSLTPENFTYFDDWCQTLTGLHETDTGDLTYFTWSITRAAGCWSNQYLTTYYDAQTQTIDYLTPLFRDMFDTLWTGWRINDTMFHPVFGGISEETAYRYYPSAIDPCFRDRFTIVSLMPAYDHLTTVDQLEHWRALPAPRISEDVKGNILQCWYVLINPYSKNRELAVELLEAIADDPLSSLKLPSFTLKDPAAYEEYYELKDTVYGDLHEIYQNGIVQTLPFDGEEYIRVLKDYQDGALSLDEAIAEIQRRAEFMAGE